MVGQFKMRSRGCASNGIIGLDLYRDLGPFLVVGQLL